MVGDVPVPLSSISSKVVERKFPIVHNVYGSSSLIPAEVSVTAFGNHQREGYKCIVGNALSVIDLAST